MDWIASLALIVALGSLVVSIVTLVVGARLQARDQNLSMLSGVLSDLRGPELRPEIAYIKDNLAKDYPDPSQGLRQLREQDRDKVRAVMGRYNLVGALLANRVASIRLISSLMGKIVEDSWMDIYPYLVAERRLRGDDDLFYAYFEHLAAESSKFDRARAAKSRHFTRWSATDSAANPRLPR